MKFLCRAKLARHLISCNFYATMTAPRPRTNKPPPELSQTATAQVDEITVLTRRPPEIPFQKRVANFVNLIGRVAEPVKYVGKDLATTVVFEGDSAHTAAGNGSIPVLFEGDLAHNVVCHVKVNDCVLVTGSLEPVSLLGSYDGNGEFHVMAKNVNFVEGYMRNRMPRKSLKSGKGKEGEGIGGNGTDETMINRNAGEENDVKAYCIVKDEGGVSLGSGSEETKISRGIGSFDRQWKDGGGVMLGNVTGSRGNGRFNRNDGEENGVKAYCNVKNEGEVSKEETKISRGHGSFDLDMWRDVVENPIRWYDYRGHKANGLVVDYHPDFTEKGSGEGMWIDRAPSWVLSELEKLKFDVPGGGENEQGGK